MRKTCFSVKSNISKFPLYRDKANKKNISVKSEKKRQGSRTAIHNSLWECCILTVTVAHCKFLTTTRVRIHQMNRRRQPNSMYNPNKQSVCSGCTMKHWDVMNGSNLRSGVWMQIQHDLHNPASRPSATVFSVQWCVKMYPSRKDEKIRNSFLVIKVLRHTIN